ncbi:putative ABC transporter permease subunit [Salibacterium aidingense]|uniref:putative ABC transporter permease subunit n=1 Tax=Salibacterium aidingense TaxID=384933 RepID=UPI0003FED48B|nr:hypothetical protein [Salibacterium aidingense]
MIRVLLNVQWKIAKHTMETNRAQTNAGYAIAGLVLFGVLLLMMNMITSLPETYAVEWLRLLFSYVFLMMMGFLLLMGIPQVFKHLYAANDLSLLFTLPIKARHIYWVKYMQSFIGVPAILFIFTFFLGIPYGARVGAHWFYYPALPLILISFLALGLALAYFINMGLVHIIPAKRANELMTAMSAVSGLLVYGIFQIPNFFMDEEDFTNLQSGIVPEMPGWLPMSWGASALTKAMEGDGSFLFPLLLLFAAAVGLSFLASILVEKGFRTGWIQLNEGKNKKKKAAAAKTMTKVRHVVTEIGWKEWRYMKRDVREWLIFMPFVFFFIFVGAGYFTSGAEAAGIREWDPLLTWTVVQAVVFLMFAFFNGSIAASFVARETVSNSILPALPITGKQIVLGKLWISWLLPWILVSMIETAAGIFLGWAFWQFAASLLMNGLVSVGISAMGIWIGIIGGKYNPANPQNRIQFAPSLLLLVMSYVYVFAVIAPFFILAVPASYTDFFHTLSRAMPGFIGGTAGAGARLLEWKMINTIAMTTGSIIIFFLLTAGCTLWFIQLAAKKMLKEKG